jgi:DnaJ-class molecular chaperone
MDTKKGECAFCSGTGKDPFSLLSEISICQVCFGRQEVEFSEPALACVFCKGSGVYPGKRLTCTVCFGKGMVSVRNCTKAECPVCEGNGTTVDSGLPCLKCKGRGLVSK